jgi:hypothetical protein
VTLRLWQIVVLAVMLLMALTLAALFGRYVIPHDPVNRTGSEFERHMNDAFMARRGSYEAQRRIEERYGIRTQATETVSSALNAASGAIEAYAARHGGYSGAQNDSALKNVVVWTTARSYCLQMTAGGAEYHKLGPVGDVIAGGCAPGQSAR